VLFVFSIHCRFCWIFTSNCSSFFSMLFLLILYRTFAFEVDGISWGWSTKSSPFTHINAVNPAVIANQNNVALTFSKNDKFKHLFAIFKLTRNQNAQWGHCQRKYSTGYCSSIRIKINQGMINTFRNCWIIHRIIAQK